MALQKYVPESEMVRNPPFFQKLGITQHSDAEMRFDPEFHWKHKFALEPIGQDYHVSCKWSASFPTEEIAMAMEKVWLVKWPKNIWVDKQYNGCTECRFFKMDEWEEIVKDYKKRYPSKMYGYKPGYWKVYLMLFTKKKVAPSEILSYI